MNDTTKTNMKKEPRNSNRGIVFKFITVCMLIAAVGLVHFEYIKHKALAAKGPEVMNVHIETHTNATSVEEDTAIALSENNLIASAASEDVNAKASQEKFQQYRMHLSVVGNLCMKFLNHENYSEELALLNKNASDYPEDIAKLLNELKDYESKYLVDQSEAYKKLNLEGGFATNMVSKIIDIEKKNPQYEEHAQEYKKLAAELKKLMTYFYSKEFLNHYEYKQ